MFQIATTLEEVVSAEAGERSEFEEWVRFQLRKETGRNYRIIVSELQLQMPIDKPEKYIAKLATRLGISVTTQACALSLLDKADRLRFLSHPPPMALAASALYAACRLKGEKLTQQQIAQVAEIKEGTIRNWYLKLAPGEFE
jgi:transcription initiation factor TFIIB